jgi:hypothetical protein
MNEIRASGINPIALSNYLDGDYFCLPNPDYYSHYDKNILQKDLNKIIHTSMFSKTNFGHFGHWYSYMGNLPLLVEMVADDSTELRSLFESFESFMRISGAWNTSNEFPEGSY